MKKIFNGFKQFIWRGNVIDLAVGVMIGGVFNSVVSALVRDIMTPLIAAIFQQPDFSKMTFAVNGSQVLYGDFISSLITFFITAFTIYFFVVLPANAFHEKMHSKDPVLPPTTKQCPECLTAIPIAAKRCAACTVELPPNPAPA